MATFQVSNNKKKEKTKKNVKKIVGWSLLAISTFIFVFSATQILPFLQTFFLGLFGIFVYPFCFVGLVISLALLNNKKYVMPKSYAVFLILSLYFLLSIVQLIILGSAEGLSYGEYVGLNYSLKYTAGGLFIGFIPSSLMVWMGTAATYIIFSLAFVTSIAFFIEAYISIKKTKEADKPIKLQIKDKEEKAETREEKVFQKQFEEELADVLNQQTAEPVNIMLAGNIEQEEKKEISAREKLGLVGGNKAIVQEQFFSQKVEIPPAPEADKLPEGMSMREYLLSPPTVDLQKFRNQQARKKPQSNYFINQAKPQQQEVQANEDLAVEAQQTFAQMKEETVIQPEVQQQQIEEIETVNNLSEIKPEEITNEAEDIIKSVVEQEQREREEMFEPAVQPVVEQPTKIEVDETEAFAESVVEEIEAQEIQQEEPVDDYNEFIDFDDIEPEVQPEPEPPRREFSRDRGNFSRDNIDLGRRNQMPSRDNFSRQDLGGRDNVLQNRDRTFRDPYNDEMERRRGFVQVEPEKKPEVIKPYNYKRPSLDLIQTASQDPATFNAEMSQKSVALENALESFGVPAKVQNVVIGPTVTRYEIEMPEGISVKKILSLDADIAYALSANGQIRIEAPIPGRSIVGIEVPNKKVAMVSIKDVLNSKEFTMSPSPLTFALGKDISGNVKVCNLQKMPHLLVAGTTGSGKSVCLNTIITSLIYKSSPEDVKFIMIDPKRVELSMYEGIPHMVIPRVITDSTKAVNALSWAVEEMERRFNLISDARVRNLEEYNQTDLVLQKKAKKIPYLVIIFDEFADFMAVAKNDIEDKVRRITAKARAAGIHLILATQRPSTDVVTGTLKGNLPARIAFKVASRVDSEVILGATGAEKLLGYGDMLYKPSDTDSQRIQGCYITTDETKSVVKYVVDNNEEQFDGEAMDFINNPNKGNKGGDNGEKGCDPLMPQALKICIDNGVASATMLQRKLSIGYPKAARIIEQMEERGYISTADGAKQRSVYISIEEFYSIFGDIYD